MVTYAQTISSIRKQERHGKTGIYLIFDAVMDLLYRSKYFAVHQCVRKRCFLFETEQKSVWLSFCQLLALRQKVNQIDLMSHFDDRGNTSGIEILLFCNCEHVLVLDTYRVIDLKEFTKNLFAIVDESIGISASPVH